MAPDTSERSRPLPLKDAALLKNQCYIDGRWCDADSGETFDIVNPATAAKIVTGPMMGAAETAREGVSGAALNSYTMTCAPF